MCSLQYLAIHLTFTTELWTPDQCPASVKPWSSRPCVLVTHRGVGAGQGHDTQTLSWLLVLARNIGGGGERGNDV